jgi:hypothetical protein
MKHRIASLFSFVCLVAFLSIAVAAKADTLTFVSASAQSGGEYIQPYEFSLNGSPNTIGLMCMDLNRGITFGETWNVTEVSVMASKQYEEEAYIFGQLGKGTYTDADVQWAGWSIFDPTGVQNAGQNTASVQNLLAEAEAAVTAGLPDSFYNQFVLYIPTSDQTGWTAGIPQEFIGTNPVPEPGTLALMGSGLMGLAGVIKRMRRS